MIVEEILELQDEVIEAQNSAEYLETITTNKIEHLTDLTKLSTASIKGWLFTYYTILNDIERCNMINY